MTTPTSHVRELLRFNRPPTRRWPVAVKAATAQIIPLTIGALTGHLELAFMATLGGFTVLYGATAPAVYRVKVMTAAACGLVLAVALGTLTAHHPAWSIVTVTLVATIAATVCVALKVGPPGAYFFPLVTGVSGLIVTHGTAPATIIGVATAGAVCGFLVGLGDLVGRPHAPEKAMIAAAAKAVAAYEGSPDDEKDAHRVQASAALHRAWTGVRDGGSVPGLVAEVDDLQLRYTRTLTTEVSRVVGLAPRPWGAVHGDDEPDDADRVEDPLGLEADARTEREGDASDDELVRDSSLGRPGPVDLMLRARRWPNEILLILARVLLATGVAGGLGYLAGTDHVYWAAGSATLVLHQGGTRVSQTYRGLQRFVGTFLGLLVFVVLSALFPEPWMAAVLVVVLQYVIELLVVRNYGAAVVFITPLALTVGSMGHGATPRELAVDRGIDTVIGVVTALVVLWATGRGTAVPFVRAHGRRVVDSVAQVLRDLENGTVRTDAALERRRLLYYELLESDEVARRALVDEPDAVRPYRRMERSVAELGYLVLGLCWHPERVHDGQVYAEARLPLERIQASSVRTHRPADDIAGDIEQVTSTLRHRTT